MSSEVRRRPVLLELYQQFLADEDAAAFVHRVSLRYNAATLCRLVAHRSRLVRRATVLALGYIADFRSNAALGRVLSDSDRAVRLLAENAIRSVWVRQGKEAHRREINAIMALNTGKQFDEARERQPIHRQSAMVCRRLEPASDRQLLHRAVRGIDQGLLGGSCVEPVSFWGRGRHGPELPEAGGQGTCAGVVPAGVEAEPQPGRRASERRLS